jgi:hypothetical protein
VDYKLVARNPFGIHNLIVKDLEEVIYSIAISSCVFIFVSL